MFRRIEPARVAQTAPETGGVPFSEHYGDVYASRDGAYAQAVFVFLRGNDLPQRWRGREQFVIIETGFGLGVNFMAAWRAWRDDPQRPRRLHFVSIEKHPVDAATLQRWAPAEVAQLAGELAAVWPLPIAGVQRREFEAGGVTLTLALGDAEALLPQLVAGTDAFFLDGFAPDRNPAMWSPRVLKALARCARDGATLATWCTARAVRDALAATGFDITLDEGFGRKRHMLRGRFAPRWRVRRHEPPVPYAGERSALVVGAGLAGATAASALAQRGWRVQLLERGARPASGASALPWGLLHPHITQDDNDTARLTRAGCFVAHAMLERIAPRGTARQSVLWRNHGTFVQADDVDEAARWQACAALLDLPAAFAQFRTADEAAASLGVAPRHAGWWFPGGATVAASKLCEALVAQTGVTLRSNTTVARLRRAPSGWIAEDPGGAALASAPICIVASAHDAARLLELSHVPVHPVLGRVSVFAAPALASLRAALSGGGTLTPNDARTVLAGATYETDAAEDAPALDAASVHDGNLQRLSRLVATPFTATPVDVFSAARCVARDRQPLVGAVADESATIGAMPSLRGAHLADLPRRAGLYASFAFGSRGLALAPLAAELIAAQIEGEPWPLERELAARIDVARFLLEVVRRGKALAGTRRP